MVGQTVILGLLYAFAAGEAAVILYCQQAVNGIACNTKVILNVRHGLPLSSSTHSLLCPFNMASSSGWQFQFMKNVTYEELCHTQYRILRKLISSQYSYKAYVDGYPVVWCYPTPEYRQCSDNLTLGCHNRATHTLDCAKISRDWNIPTSIYLFNHFHFKVSCRSLYHHNSIWKIEGVELTLVSCSAPPCAPPSHPEGLLLPKKQESPLDLKLSYSIEFVDVAPHAHHVPERPPPLQLEPVWCTALLVLTVAYIIFLFIYHYWSQFQKESAHWLEAAEVKKGEPPLPQHNMLLSVLVCSGGRLAATAVVGLMARWMDMLPTIHMSFSEPTALVLYIIIQSSLGGIVSGYVCRVIQRKLTAMETVIVVLSFLPSTAAMFVCISNQLAIFSNASPWAMLLFFLLLWAGIDMPLSLWGLTHRCAQVWSVNLAAGPHTFQYPNGVWRRIFFDLGSVAPFLCIVPQLDPILDYLQGIHTITFNCGFALLHLVGMLVTSGLYGFITASGQRTSWHWDSFFATRHSSLLQLVYLLFFSKAYAGHTFLFLNWAIVMTFSFFLMSGAVGFFAASLRMITSV